MTVLFGVLGDIEALVDGQQADLGHTRQRCVLAALLVDANRAVPVDQLLERVWAERLPQRARNALYSYLSRLRQALATTGDGTTIARQSGGYLLSVDTAAVDLHRFRDLVGQARAAAEEERAMALLERALGLWRGEAFANADTPWFNALRDTLDGERFAAELDLYDIHLRQGHHTRLLSRLTAQVPAHPLDERLAGQLMLALYRCGRPADALDHYRQTRARLAEELGIDPGHALQRLHQQILTADPALAPGAEATAAAPVPRQLPSRPALFTGRTRELDTLDRALDAQAEPGGTVVITAIGGSGGIGKTWLALHWAHQHLKRFPDGQLYVNLRGFDPTDTPMSPATAVRGFLDALGVSPDAIPAGLDAQAGLYRSLVADKRMLIVLDNARDTAQITPLLPGSPECAVLVTSRLRLTGLTATHSARPVSLDVLPPPEARQLLTRHLGADRLAAEPHATVALLQRCAGLPLALGIVAARAAAHPDFPLAVMAEELHETATRLDALDTGDLSADLRTVFAASQHALDDDAARLFALLGLAPGPDISLPAAASLAALPLPRARTLLRTLETAHLIQQHAPGRYRMHDLVHLFAAERGEHELPAEVRSPALTRLVDFYLHTAHTGHRLLDAHRMPIELSRPGAGIVACPLPDRAAALAWYDAEYPCLTAVQRLAVEQGRHAPAWQLAWTLDTFRWHRGYFDDSIAAWRIALTSAERLGQPDVQARAHNRLGTASTETGRHPEALHHLDQALTLFEQVGDTAGQAATHHALGKAWERQGAPERTLPHLEHALRLYRALGDARGEARLLNATGWYHARLGDFEHARPYCEEALVLLRRHSQRQSEAATLDSLGYIAQHTGRHAQALDHFRSALLLFRDIGNTSQEAETLARIGETHQALGQWAEARGAWSRALDLYRAQHRATEAKHVGEQLDALDACVARTREDPRA